MTTGSNAGDGHRELFVADFYPRLGEYLARRHATGYDAVAARTRFLTWLAQHADKRGVQQPGANRGGVPDAPPHPGDVMAANALADFIAEAGPVPEPGAGEVAELGTRIAAGRDAERALAAGGGLAPGDRASLEAAADHGRRARDRLLAAHLGLVSTIAGRFTGRGVPLLELVTAGNRGLVRAAEKFDPDKGYIFSTYATWWIRQSITRAVADKDEATAIPVPEALAISRIADIERRLSLALGREPTPEEVAAELADGGVGRPDHDREYLLLPWTRLLSALGVSRRMPAGRPPGATWNACPSNRRSHASRGSPGRPARDAAGPRGSRWHLPCLCGQRP